ncbi:hypothetical protein LCGC14_0263860 [marine sediment metagenome]|uniref:Uncharacterized protein n=1 Tax=marine sediment metagenome TaxID=412755 RepID=A0A0F9UHM1_9ZZZZ
MVTGAVDTIELKLVVDKAEMEQQLGQALVASGPPSAGAGPSKGGIPVEPGVKMGKSLAGIAKLGGIALGITALVKGSKVMTTTLGAFSTVMGAMVDVFLAPLMVQLLPVLEKLAKWIPIAQTAGETVADIVRDAKTTFEKGPTPATKFMLGGDQPPGETRERGELWKKLGKSVIQQIWEVIKDPSIYGDPRKEAEMRARIGLAPLRGRGEYTGEVAPQIGSLGGGQIPLRSLERILEFNNEQLKTFLERRAERPNIDLTINGDNIEDIMSEVRRQIETVMRDKAIPGFAGS